MRIIRDSCPISLNLRSSDTFIVVHSHAQIGNVVCLLQDLRSTFPIFQPSSVVKVANPLRLFFASKICAKGRVLMTNICKTDRKTLTCEWHVINSYETQEAWHLCKHLHSDSPNHNQWLDHLSCRSMHRFIIVVSFELILRSQHFGRLTACHCCMAPCKQHHWSFPMMSLDVFGPRSVKKMGLPACIELVVWFRSCIARHFWWIWWMYAWHA